MYSFTARYTGEAWLSKAYGVFILRESFGAYTNLAGLANYLSVAGCWPLVSRPGLLFDYTYIEVGLALNPSLGGSVQTAYAEIAPLSFLVFRAMFSGILVWVLPWGD